jgi:hypothetical protein
MLSWLVDDLLDAPKSGAACLAQHLRRMEADTQRLPRLAQRTLIYQSLVLRGVELTLPTGDSHLNVKPFPACRCLSELAVVEQRVSIEA